MIARQSGHLGRLVDDLLDVARVMTGKILLEREPLDLAELVAPDREHASPRSGKRRPALTHRDRAGLGRRRRARLEQIVTNLLTTR